MQLKVVCSLLLQAGSERPTLISCIVMRSIYINMRSWRTNEPVEKVKSEKSGACKIKFEGFSTVSAVIESSANDRVNRATDNQKPGRNVENRSNILTVESPEYEPLRLNDLLCIGFSCL
jgi:hypothetical protein